MTDPTNARRVIIEMFGDPSRSNCVVYRDGRRYDLLTLDGYAALWRDKLPGWRWTRLGNLPASERSWYAYHNEYSMIEVPDTGDELADRERLTARVCEVMKGAK